MTAQESPASISTSSRRRHSYATYRDVVDLFLVPAVVILIFLVLAAVSVIGDQNNGIAFLDGLRRGLEHVIGKDTASDVLQSIATGLVTVTSITFSVLLLAVQQTASTLSPVVFEQFLRSRANQAFLGFFVGLALFSYLVVAMEGPTPPVIGAAVASAATAVALIILLLLVYSTINQMRPTSVLRAMHNNVLRARESELALIRATRRTTQSGHPAHATYWSNRTGYVVSIDHDHLGKALQDTEDAEIILHTTIGQYVTFGDVLAEVRDGDEERAKRLAEDVAKAIDLRKMRNSGLDATAGIDQLGNIAWTCGSTAKQNPEVAREALFQLKDIASRWMYDQQDTDEQEGNEPYAIVYEDNDLSNVLDKIYSTLIVAYESKQHMLAAETLDVYSSLFERSDNALRDRLERDVTSLTSILEEMPPSLRLDAARRRFRGMVECRR